MKTVALTGATGFIGSMLLNHLTGQGFRIKALYRHGSPPHPDPIDAVEWHAGNLEDANSLRVLVADSDAIVHCAGAVRGATPEQFIKINVKGTDLLLKAATEERVPRFLLMSSLAAREPSLSAYAASKKRGEDVLEQYRDMIFLNILRPPAVYGPGDREMLPLLKLIKRGIIPVTGIKEGRFSLIYIDDLTTAVSGLLKAENVQDGQCFELHDGHPDGYNWQQIATIASILNGKAPRCFSIPRPLLQTAARINLALSLLGGYQPMLTPGKVKELFHPNWVCDNTALVRATGWHPQIQFKDGMQKLFY